MKTQYYTATSLDGFIADRNHSLEWLFQFSESPEGSYEAFIEQVGALAMGSSTYEWVVRHLGDHPALQAWPYRQPAWVFTSRQLTPIEGADIRFVSGDVRPVRQQMTAAAQGKNLWIVGGGDLVGEFYDQGLLDELILQIASVTLGGGFPLLPRAIVSPPLRLQRVKQFGTAFVELVYEVAKKP